MSRARGQPRKLSDAQVEAAIRRTLKTKPAGATHWSTRSMAQACGLNQTAVSRIWRAFALQPQRSKNFKLSKDPLFLDKVRDIVGLYLIEPWWLVKSGRTVVCCPHPAAAAAQQLSFHPAVGASHSRVPRRSQRPA